MPFTGNINLDFIFFAIQGDSDSVQALLDKGADVNAKEDCGGTALMWAAAFGHINTVQTLIENGADVNIKDEEGHTALMLADRKGQSEIVRLLKKIDANG